MLRCVLGGQMLRGMLESGTQGTLDTKVHAEAR